MARAADPAEKSRAQRAEALAAMAPLLARSAKRAGVRAVAAGQWLADTMQDVAAQLPLRDAAALRAAYPGRTDAQIAAALIRSASRVTMTLGGAAGAIAAVEFAAPPTLLAAPVQLAAHLLAVAAVEVKLVAELHELAGRHRSLSTRDRGLSALVSWGHGRALDVAMGGAPGAGGVIGLSALTAAARAQVRKQVTRRLGRSGTTLAPMMLGAMAGAELDRRATLGIGRRVARDLGLGRLKLR